MTSSDSRRTTTSGDYEETPLFRGTGANLKQWLRSLGPKLVFTLAVGFIGLVLVTVLIVLSVRGATNARQDCTLSAEMPQLSAPNLATCSTSNATGMVKLAAYIEIYDEGFLPLSIERMVVSEEEATIRLEDNCASVSIGYKNEGQDAISISGLEWNFQRQDGAAVATEETRAYCSIIEPEFRHSFPKSDRYSCIEREVYQCQTPESSSDRAHAFAQLVIGSLELELDGNPEAIRAGNFSKSPFGSSCTD